MNIIIKSLIAVCALLTATTAFGATAFSTKSQYINGFASNSAGDQFQLYAVEYHYPATIYLNVTGTIGGEYFVCFGYDPSLIGTLDVSTTASKATFKLNRSQISCDGPAPESFLMECTATGDYLQNSVCNTTEKGAGGIAWKGHTNCTYSRIACKVVVDDVPWENFDYGSLGYCQYTDSSAK